ncbi:MAG: hypothetical protein JNL11_03140 [Bdellovibrionaceae bacterium]|nr:hypothetical protein [Pseudobdellovibrionaceae bacterium]
MKWIFAFLISCSTMASTFIGNGGQTGDLELAVSMKQIREAIVRMREVKIETPNRRFCVCPENYRDHQLCETVEKLNEDQKIFCDRFIQTQMSKLENASQTTQFEWVKTSIVNQNKVGTRVVDAVARKDKKLIYIDQSRFVDITGSQRMFLITHELFHMDTFDGIKLDDEDPIGPFKNEYGIRDLLNAAAASITLTSIDETVFQDYSRYLSQSRSTGRHWVGLYSASNSLQDDKSTNYKTEMTNGSRFAYQYQFDSLFGFGVTVNIQNQSGNKTIFGSARIDEKRSSKAVGVTYRYFLFNNMDPFTHYWNMFLQFELLTERMDATFKMHDEQSQLESSASSTSPVFRVNLFFPIKHGFWLNAGIDFSQHKMYYPREFDYTLVSKTPNFFLGASYGF